LFCEQLVQELQDLQQAVSTSAGRLEHDFQTADSLSPRQSHHTSSYACSARWCEQLLRRASELALGRGCNKELLGEPRSVSSSTVVDLVLLPPKLLLLAPGAQAVSGWATAIAKALYW
jgi:hypothetical protein